MHRLAAARRHYVLDIPRRRHENGATGLFLGGLNCICAGPFSRMFRETWTIAKDIAGSGLSFREEVMPHVSLNELLEPLDRLYAFRTLQTAVKRARRLIYGDFYGPFLEHDDPTVTQPDAFCPP